MLWDPSSERRDRLLLHRLEMRPYFFAHLSLRRYLQFNEILLLQRLGVEDVVRGRILEQEAVET